MKVDDLRTGKQYDRRIRFSDEMKKEVLRLYNAKTPIREIARQIPVDRRMIQFFLFPERHTKNIEDRAERGGSKQYYDRDKWRETMREHRAYKKKIRDKLLK